MTTIAAQAAGVTNDGVVEVLWETLTTTNRDGAPINWARYPDKTFQIIGDFSGTALIAIEGSCDGGVTWSPCHDIKGDEIAIGAAGFVLVVESPKLIRPYLSDGNGSADIDVYMVAVARAA